MKFAPPAVASAVRASLADKACPSYGQVATADASGRAHARTVHLRWIPEKDTLGFSVHVNSWKWKHMRRTGRVAGVFFDARRLVQWRFEGPAQLLDAGCREDALLDRMWRLMRPDVRATYWREFLGKRGAVDPVPRAPTLGVVVCRPVVWDIFKLHSKDYGKARRTVYRLRDGAWIGARVSSLDGSPR
jgi:hypothetical protein